MEERLNHQALLMGVGGPWTMKESPIPKPGPGQALIKMKAASICNMTDLHTIQGYHPPHDHQFQGMIPHDVRMYLHKKNDPLAHLYPKHAYSDDVSPFPTLMGHEGMGEIVELGPKLNYLLRGQRLQDWRPRRYFRPVRRTRRICHCRSGQADRCAG